MMKSLFFCLWFHVITSFQLSLRIANRRPSFVVRKSTTNEDTTIVNGITKKDYGYYSIETSFTGPSDNGPVHKLTIHSISGDDTINNNTLLFETGKMGRLAAGAVTLTRGDTVLYATASRDELPKDDVDFLPLSIEHQERFSSAGMTSGSYTRRDGRPAEHEILTCRLMDRPIRPSIRKGWKHETQILSWVLSYDGLRSCDPLAVIAGATALYLSDVPLEKSVAAVMVGRIRNNETNATNLVLNPTHEEMSNSSLHLIVAGTKDAVLMIEGAAEFLPEDEMIDAVQFGHDAIRDICVAIETFGDVVGITKKVDTIPEPIPNLKTRVATLMTPGIDEWYGMSKKQGYYQKQQVGAFMTALQNNVTEILLQEDFPQYAIASACKELIIQKMFELTKETGFRLDGRGVTDIRKLDMETHLLPRVHGSALFTRGQTQALATATLGGAGMKQKIDKLDGTENKRFYLQYTFPPSCVGETGRVGAPGRREVGHGNLAERALIPTLPSEEDFPYSIRVESLVTESHGSSSMASVCGGCLALMDAGVPIKTPVAGIAMGMLLGDDDDCIILSDILGTEDALGTMDFKVAGDRHGITTFQLDIKCEGLTVDTMKKALEQARQGRLRILNAMQEVLPKPRDELPDTIPKMATFAVPFESIGKIIGPGGKQIRAIIEDYRLESMDVNDDGVIQISSFDANQLTQVEEFVTKTLLGGESNNNNKQQKSERPKYQGPDPEQGVIYKGKIMGIHPFGVFVEILPGQDEDSPGLEGLCHVSELAKERVRNCEGFVKSMNTQELEVMYLGLNEKGQIRLSRKAVLEQRNNKKNNNKSSKKETKKPEMSQEELDIITKVIEDL